MPQCWPGTAAGGWRRAGGCGEASEHLDMYEDIEDREDNDDVEKRRLDRRVIAAIVDEGSRLGYDVGRVNLGPLTEFSSKILDNGEQ